MKYNTQEERQAARKAKSRAYSSTYRNKIRAKLASLNNPLPIKPTPIRAAIVTTTTTPQAGLPPPLFIPDHQGNFNYALNNLSSTPQGRKAIILLSILTPEQLGELTDQTFSMQQPTTDTEQQPPVAAATTTEQEPQRIIPYNQALIIEGPPTIKNEINPRFWPPFFDTIGDYLNMSREAPNIEVSFLEQQFDDESVAEIFIPCVKVLVPFTCTRTEDEIRQFVYNYIYREIYGSFPFVANVDEAAAAHKKELVDAEAAVAADFDTDIIEPNPHKRRQREQPDTTVP